MMKIKEARDKTIAIERARKKKEKEDNLRREIRIIEEAQEEEKQKKLRAKRDKVRRLKEAAKVRAENERLRLIREEQDEKDRLEDIRLQEENAARELKKEADRKAYFDKTAADQAARQARNVESRKEEFDQAAEDGRRAERQQQELEERQKQRAEEDRLRRLQELEERNKILKKQVEEKRRRAMERRSHDSKYVQIAKEEIVQYESRLKAEKINKRRKQLEYQDMLRQQIASGGGGVDKNVTSMTQGERALNQEKLQKIHGNPELMNTLLNRIKFGSPGKKKQAGKDDYDDEEDF